METKVYKHHCSQCDFSCDYNSSWEKHIATELHQTGTRKKRNDIKDPYKCEHCEYQTKNVMTFKKHKLNAHSNKETRRKEFKFYCDYCDLGTFSKDTFNSHNDSQKHKLMVKRNES